MKFVKCFSAPLFVAALFLIPSLASAQDADKKEMTEIEKAFAAHPNAGPDAAAVSKQYLFDGTLVQLTGMGQVGTLTKARVIELNSKPNPTDPNVKSTTTVSDFQVQIYGDTALVAYKMTNTDTGHKDTALNVTDHFSCLDTFVKRTGHWLVIANSCASTAPLPQAEWDAAKKAMADMPKDVKDAYH